MRHLLNESMLVESFYFSVFSLESLCISCSVILLNESSVVVKVTGKYNVFRKCYASAAFSMRSNHYRPADNAFNDDFDEDDNIIIISSSSSRCSALGDGG